MVTIQLHYFNYSNCLIKKKNRIKLQWLSLLFSLVVLVVSMTMLDNLRAVDMNPPSCLNASLSKLCKSSLRKQPDYCVWKNGKIDFLLNTVLVLIKQRLGLCGQLQKQHCIKVCEDFNQQARNDPVIILRIVCRDESCMNCNLN